LALSSIVPKVGAHNKVGVNKLSLKDSQVRRLYEILSPREE